MLNLALVLRQAASFRYGSTAPTAFSETFNAANLLKNIRKDLLPLPEFNPKVLTFGRWSSDHLVQIDHSATGGWENPTLGPFKNLQIHPFNSSLHYSIQCFEGMKAYKNQKGEIRLFRPDCNAARFRKSSKRMSLPDFNPQELVKIIEEFTKAESRWIPPFSEYSLYIRPLHISMDSTLGVKSPSASKLLIMGGPVGPYYPTGFNPVSLSCAIKGIRSAPKGTGSYKIGGNYSPTLQHSEEVIAKGHQQALWLLDDQIIEVGASNIFFVFKDSTGDIEIVTPALEDLVLPGVTRDSILTLLEDQKQYKVTERKITMTEFLERHKKGQLLECFGAGTAVIVSPVKNIEYKGRDYPIHIDPKIMAGPITAKIRKQLLDIQEGRAEDKFKWTRVIN